MDVKIHTFVEQGWIQTGMHSQTDVWLKKTEILQLISPNFGGIKLLQHNKKGHKQYIWTNLLCNDLLLHLFLLKKCNNFASWITQNQLRESTQRLLRFCQISTVYSPLARLQSCPAELSIRGALSKLASDSNIKRKLMVSDYKSKVAENPHCGKAIEGVLKWSTSHSEECKHLFELKFFSAAYKLYCNLLCQLIGGDLNKPSQSMMDGHMQERQSSATFSVLHSRSVQSRNK